VTLPRPTGDHAARRARALVDGTRRRLLDELGAGPLDVRALATRAGLHENAVRQHLSVLRDAGLVVEDVERVAGRVGRPRSLYRSAGATTPAVNPFERLATLLAEVAAGRPAAEVGAEDGVALAMAHVGRDTADVVADIATGSGFAVRVDRRPDGTRVVLGGCPFAAIAGPVVCALHRGVAEGAARAAGGAVTRFDVADPAVRPCELTLAPFPEGFR
jgi:predicted ArsR family transcriptional regulator